MGLGILSAVGTGRGQTREAGKGRKERAREALDSSPDPLPALLSSDLLLQAGGWNQWDLLAS